LILLTNRYPTIGRFGSFTRDVGEIEWLTKAESQKVRKMGSTIGIAGDRTEELKV